jgi:hypothetical protein
MGEQDIKEKFLVNAPEAIRRTGSAPGRSRSGRFR